jgi:hypothetical protein
MDTIDHDVAPAGTFARVFPLAIGGMFGLAFIGTVLGVGLRHPQVLIGAVPAFLLAFVVVAGMAWIIRNPRVRLADGVLVAGRLPTLRAPIADLDLDAARVVDLDAEPGLQPTFRLLGTSLPGYRTGWFYLRDRSRAFLVVTDAKRVLVLPRRDAGPVLLSACKPDALLAALRRARG